MSFLPKYASLLLVVMQHREADPTSRSESACSRGNPTPLPSGSGMLPSGDITLLSEALGGDYGKTAEKSALNHKKRPSGKLVSFFSLVRCLTPPTVELSSL